MKLSEEKYMYLLFSLFEQQSNEMFWRTDLIQHKDTTNIMIHKVVLLIVIKIR